MNTSSLIAHGIRMLLPFSERIAARMLVAAAASFVAFATVITLAATGTLAVHAGTFGFALVAVSGTAFVTTFIGFLVLFSGFSQQSGVAMKGIGSS